MRLLSVHDAESRMETCLIYYKPPLDVCPVHTWIHRPHERRELILRPTKMQVALRTLIATPARGHADLEHGDVVILKYSCALGALMPPLDTRNV